MQLADHNVATGLHHRDATPREQLHERVECAVVACARPAVNQQCHRQPRQIGRYSAVPWEILISEIRIWPRRGQVAQKGLTITRRDAHILRARKPDATERRPRGEERPRYHRVIGRVVGTCQVEDTCVRAASCGASST